MVSVPLEEGVNVLETGVSVPGVPSELYVGLKTAVQVAVFSVSSPFSLICA